jgi:hypothetical protein
LPPGGKIFTEAIPATGDKVSDNNNIDKTDIVTRQVIDMTESAITHNEEAILCDCGNLAMVNPVTQDSTLVFLCDSCIVEMEKSLNISYQNGDI